MSHKEGMNHTRTKVLITPYATTLSLRAKMREEKYIILFLQLQYKDWHREFRVAFGN